MYIHIDNFMIKFYHKIIWYNGMKDLIVVKYLSYGSRQVHTFSNITDLDQIIVNKVQLKDLLLSLCNKLKQSTHMNNWQFNNRYQIVELIFDELKLCDNDINSLINKNDLFDIISNILPSDSNHILEIEIHNISLSGKKVL